VVADRPDRQRVELGEFVVELADLVLPQAGEVNR